MVASINLAALNGTNGFVINGIDEYDLSPSSISNAGDINGDGIDDLIIGTPSAYSRIGKSYVIFGGVSVGKSGSLELSSLDDTDGFVINGIDSRTSRTDVPDQSGTSVSNAGDINGDGFDDFIIGAPGANPNGIKDAGESYVIFGEANIREGSSLELSALDGTNGFVINGASYFDSSGVSVSNAGDMNGDGIDDLIIGAPGANGDAGESYVVFGVSNVGQSGSLELSALDGTDGFVINGIDSGDLSGVSVSNAGDVNGDGFDDLIISSPPDAFGPGFLIVRGDNYVVFGGSNVGQSGSLELSSLDGTNGFVIGGSGIVIKNAGDVNGDGIDDLIYRGRSVVFGGANIGSNGSLELSALDGSNGFAINESNFWISSAGDMNGDGIDDLIINNSSEEEGYVVFGGANIGSNGSLELSALDESNSFVINGIDSGSLVIDAGDINGDGINDLIIHSPGNYTTAGKAYVIFGFKTEETPEITGTANNDILSGTPEAETISGLGGNDSLKGLAGNDNILGGDGNDTLRGNNGNDVINGGDGNDNIWGQADNDSIDGGKGADRILGNNGEDTLNGGDDIDTLRGGNGNDSLFGDAGDDQVVGNAGNDTLFGGADNDILFAGTGEDELFGEEGNDVLWGQADDDFVDGGAGTDVLYGNNGNDVLLGGDGTDSLFGNQGNDVLVGGADNDILFGNDGNDNLYGGEGNDTLWSGSGNDVFELTRGADVGVDRIKDYIDGVDKFLLSDRFGLGSLEFSDLTITQKGNTAHISITENSQLLAIVDNTNVAQLDSSDFILG